MIPDDGDDSLPWRKAAGSGSGDCVEVSPHAGRVLVRDSKNPRGPRLDLTPHQWTAFLNAVKELA